MGTLYATDRKWFLAAGQKHVAVPDKLDRQVDVAEPNKVWCDDVACMWIGRRWGYLAVVLDRMLANRLAGSWPHRQIVR